MLRPSAFAVLRLIKSSNLVRLPSASCALWPMSLGLSLARAALRLVVHASE
jgi:hypothetical protein